MKTEWPEGNRDDTDQSDSLDSYNDEMARNAVSGLVDDEDIAISDTPGGHYVTGFDKPAARTRVIDIAEDDLPDDIAEAPPISRRRKAEREPNPPPRPALRASHANQRERTVKPRALPQNLMDDDYNDEYDTFRQRYKNHESVPKPRPQVERPDRSERERPRPVRAAYPPPNDYEEADTLPALRWVAIAVVTVVLILLAFLVYRSTSLAAQLRDAQEQLAAAPANETRLSELQLTIEDKDDRIAELEKQVEQLKAADGPGVVYQPYPNDTEDTPAEDNGMSRPDETVDTPAEPSGNTGGTVMYTVVSGDNLSKISNRHYGNANPSSIQRIRDANSLTTDRLDVGQVLTIPAE